MENTERRAAGGNADKRAIIDRRAAIQTGDLHYRQEGVKYRQDDDNTCRPMQTGRRFVHADSGVVNTDRRAAIQTGGRQYRYEGGQYKLEGGSYRQ